MPEPPSIVGPPNARLVRAAQEMHRRAAAPDHLPSLLALTDPERQPSALLLTKVLPVGSGIIVRHFGKPDLGELHAAVETAQQRGLKLLIANDPELAWEIGADGLHVPEKRLSALHSTFGSFALVTASAHTVPATRRASRMGVDAILLSSAFRSRSRSATRPLGPIRLRGRIAATDTPAYALGGITHRNVRRLLDCGAVGVAVVDAATSC